jgi:aarF domain-containing kinase
MSERASAAARLARTVLGVALTGAAESGVLGRGSRGPLRAAADLLISGGKTREAAPVAAAAAQHARTAPGTASSEAEKPTATPFKAPGPKPTPAPASKPKAAPDATTTTDGDRRASSASASTAPPRVTPSKPPSTERRAVAVPSSPIQRVIGFGSLAAGLAAGTISESARRAWRGNGKAPGADGETSTAVESILPGDSVFMTEANAERLAVALCRMRGAALKLGQMLSIQDESVIPPQVSATQSPFHTQIPNHHPITTQSPPNY